MPTTAQELSRCSPPSRPATLNRNGRADELPLSFLGAYDLKYLAQAFGLAANDFNVFVSGGRCASCRWSPPSGTHRLVPRLYERGLIDKDGFSTPDTLRRITDAKRRSPPGAGGAPAHQPAAGGVAGQLRGRAALEYQGRQVYRTVASG